MKKNTLMLAVTLLFSSLLVAQDKMTIISSANSVEATVNKLTAILKTKGLTVFDVVDHKKGAESVSMELRPTTLIIFGNPMVGTKLMKCDQTVGADLPMKFLVWQDDAGKNWIGYWKPSLLANKYTLDDCKAVLEKMDGALAKFSSIGAQ